MKKLYELAGADENRRFRPYCWRVRMALAHKGLEVESLPWHVTEKEAISFLDKRESVLIDAENTISDSWEIAKYLETVNPDTPPLKLDHGEVLYKKIWVETVLHPELLQFLVWTSTKIWLRKIKIIFGKAVKNSLGKHWKKL